MWFSRLSANVSGPAATTLPHLSGNIQHYTYVIKFAQDGIHGQAKVSFSMDFADQSIPITVDGNVRLFEINDHYSLIRGFLKGMALDNAGVIFDNGELEEITPLTSDSGKVILKETNQSDDPFESTLNPKEGDGDYISITVTNSGKYPLEFDLGRQLPSTNVTNPSAVPAGQSATRTIKINTWESIESKPVYFKVGNAEYITRSMDFTVEVRQFSK